MIGPQLVKLTSDALAVLFMGSYMAVIALNVIGSSCSCSSTSQNPPPRPLTAPKGRTRWELITTPRIAVAVICAMVSYALMNLVMTSTPLAVVGCGLHQSGRVADMRHRPRAGDVRPVVLSPAT